MRRWTFPTLGLGPLDIEVIRRGDPLPRHDLVRIHPGFARLYVEAWALDLAEGEKLIALWYAFCGESLVLGRAPIDFHTRLQPVLDAFEREDLQLWDLPRSSVTTPAVFPDAVVPPRPGAGGPRTWIEIVLLDQEQRPLADEPYRITLPDGAVRAGRLDERGFVRLDGLEPGQCDVTFPRIDGREWGR